jgi:uncharacterized repeat protein (TIGR01451 family)
MKPARSSSTHARRAYGSISRRLFALIALALIIASAASRAGAQTVCATPGAQGPANAPGLSGVVNTYFPGAASASAGATSIQLGTMRAGGSATAISSGDLLLVIQMQDGTFNSTNGAAATYGAGTGTGRGLTSTNGAGLYEYVVATSASAGNGSVSIRGTGASNGLVNAYTNAAANAVAGAGAQGVRRFQVVRVPQYSSATLSGTVTAPAWDGSTGGVVAFDVAGNLNLNGGTINVTGLGFRGGGGRPLVGGKAVAGGGNPSPKNDDYAYLSSSPVTATNGAHGSKGEGIVGTPRYVFNPVTNTVDELNPTAEGYPNGSYARGAPGNAGGGGTDGDATGVNQNNSGGGGGANGGDGGHGGNTWSDNLALGGLGGVSLINLGAGRAVLGGGGGAGSRNNSVNYDSSGASGGGMVFLRTNSVTGSGTINADGNAAYNNTANDGGGGGGAGGSVVVSASGSLSGLTVNARGGRGGDAWRSGGTTAADRHGPGGGGGGGFVAQTGGAFAFVTGGAHGITTTLADAYNSTDGAGGQSLAITQSQIPGASSGAQCVPVLTTTKTTSTVSVNNTSNGTTATYTIIVSNAASRATATGASLSDTLPTGFTYSSTGPVVLTGGATRPTTTNPTSGAAVPAWDSFDIPAGGQVSLTFTVAVASSVAAGTYQNPATATYLDPRRTTTSGTTTASYDPASSTGEDVTVVPPPHVTLCKTFPGQTCTPAPTLPDQINGADVTFVIIFTSDGGVAARTLTITDAVPTGMDFKVGSMLTNLGTTGLTVTLYYSYDGTNFVTSPVPTSGGGSAPAGYDRTVKAVRWVFNGNLSQVSPNNTGDVRFTARIR